MRVISGSAKGRKLKSPKSDIRPLSDRAKEGLFNILMNKVSEASFLDVFAGSGSVGIEALSRGARLAIFVEKDKKHVRIIRENLEDLGLYDRAEVYSLDALHTLKILVSKHAKFDIIFLGAPYDSPVLEKALQAVGETDLLKDSSVVIAEHRKQHKIQEAYGKLKSFRETRYGETVLTFYESSNLSR